MRKTVASFALALALCASASMASAQDAGEGAGGGDSAAESRATSFQAVEGSEREEIAGGGLLLGAYGTILVLLVGYVGWIAMLQQRTQRDLARLRASVEKASAAPRVG